MKTRLIITTLLCLLFAEYGFSQIKYGARLSGSMTNITEVHAHSKSRTGFQIAALATIPFNDNDIFFFQPEINFSGQGEYNQPIINDEKIKQKAFLNYINIPLNLKVFFSDAESEFYAIAGPYIGFKIGESIGKTATGNSEAEHNEFSSFDFGLNAGIGYSLNREVEFSLRYSYGLVDQVKNDWRDASNSTSILNLGVSYFFNN